jgi:NADH:ubiquinone reductase (H+-translocating)
MKQLVILGGGYGGYSIACKLIEEQLPEDVQVLLVDKNPYHTLKTEFYGLAAGTVSDKSLRMPFPTHERLTFICDVVTRMDIKEKQITLGNSGVVRYDQLIIGLGCEDSYHNIRGAREFAYSVQSLENSRKTFEAVQNTKAYGQITIVGAGLTGVELASEIRESRPDLRVRLLDKGKSILPSLPEKLQRYVTSWLEGHDIEVIHNSNVEYVENGAVCNDGQCLLTDVTIWAGGVKPNSILNELDVEKDKYGRVVLNGYHQVPGYTDIYVVGDCASLPHPPSAQVAKIQGEQIVRILVDVLNGKNPQVSEEMKIKGAIGSLGKKEGFGTAYGLSLSGHFARFMKSGILWMHKFNI